MMRKIMTEHLRDVVHDLPMEVEFASVIATIFAIVPLFAHYLPSLFTALFLSLFLLSLR